MTTVLMAVVGLVLLARLSLVLGRWAAARALEPEAGRPAERRRPSSGRLRRALQPAPTPLPEGHRPPAGLGPLSPSERFLSTEAARGLRELQLFLLDPA